MRVRGILSFVGYQAAWWGSALLAQRGRGLEALLAMAAFTAVSLAFDARRPRRLALIAGAMALGVFVDGALRATGVITFPAALDAAPVPAFMVALWAGFAAVLPIPVLSSRPLLGAVAGAVGGALAYRGGDALGVFTVGAEPLSTASIACAWALSMPLLGWLSIALRVDGDTRNP